MTRLRKMMLEELQRRNFSEDTIRHYIHTVDDFARHFNRPPDRLDLRHIREYQAHLFPKRKLSSGSVTNQLAALRFSTSDAQESLERCRDGAILILDHAAPFVCLALLLGGHFPHKESEASVPGVARWRQTML